MKSIELKGQSRGVWLSDIANFLSSCTEDMRGSELLINITKFKSGEEFLPFYMVSFACLIQRLIDLGVNVKLSCDNRELREFLQRDIRLINYWSDDNDYIAPSRDEILNLWRVRREKVDPYSDNIVLYLKQQMFENKDLSSVKMSLLEAYYNIGDHSKSEGNAFSYIYFDRAMCRLYVAICDLGVGIAKSIRGVFTDIREDNMALLKAIEYNVTVRSQNHNSGKGLANIISHLSTGDTLRIISNSALLLIKDGVRKAQKLQYKFPGTIIYYDVLLENFENEEISSNFEVDFEI